MKTQGMKMQSISSPISFLSKIMTTQKELIDWLIKGTCYADSDCPIDWHQVEDVGESGTAIVFHTEED